MRRQINSRYHFVIWLTLLAALTTTALAQGASQPTQKQDAGLKELHVIIADNKGHSLDDVKQNDIQIIEDGVPQTIESFSLVELPISYGLVIDSSGSLRTQFPTVIDTVKNIIGANRPNDVAFIVRFVHSSRIVLVQDTTSDKLQLLTALGMLRIEPGQTALIDAVYASAEKLLKAERIDRKVKHRQALVLITDGEDRSSLYKEEDLFKMLQNVGLKIFVIGLVEELDPVGGFTRKSPRERAIKLIERLTKETGGRAFFPKRAEDFPKVVAEVARDLHRQYVVRYRALPGAQEPYHNVEIKVQDTADKKKRRAILKPKYNPEELEWTVNNKQ